LKAVDLGERRKIRMGIAMSEYTSS
jgi:hypothetical protein